MAFAEMAGNWTRIGYNSSGERGCDFEDVSEELAIEIRASEFL